MTIWFTIIIINSNQKFQFRNRACDQTDPPNLEPFEVVTVYLSRQWQIEATVKHKINQSTRKNKNEIPVIEQTTQRAQVRALTIVKKASGWPEIILISNKRV